MQMIILSIHLLVCVCLIGLVLLQRSEGGALGIGGGGSGALMSGRGASDALARLTAIAGGLFLAVSLLLTWLSGIGEGPGRSVFDSLPAITAPAVVPEQAPPAEEPAATPDPTESRGPSATELAANILPGPASAAAETPAPATARAAPIESRPTATQTAAPARQPPAQRTTNQGQTQSASATTTPRTTQPQQGAVSGVSLTEPSTPESVDLGNGVEAVRRERAGPDQ